MENIIFIVEKGALAFNVFPLIFSMIFFVLKFAFLFILNVTFFQKWGLQVDQQMQIIEGRILPRPELEYVRFSFKYEAIFELSSVFYSFLKF